MSRHYNSPSTTTRELQKTKFFDLKEPTPSNIRRFGQSVESKVPSTRCWDGDAQGSSAGEFPSHRLVPETLSRVPSIRRFKSCGGGYWKLRSASPDGVAGLASGPVIHIFQDQAHRTSSTHSATHSRTAEWTRALAAESISASHITWRRAAWRRPRPPTQTGYGALKRPGPDLTFPPFPYFWPSQARAAQSTQLGPSHIDS